MMPKPSKAQAKILTEMACSSDALIEVSEIKTTMLFPGEGYWVYRKIYLNNKAHRINEKTFNLLLKNNWIAKSKGDSVENEAIYFINEVGAEALGPEMLERCQNLVAYIKNATHGKRSLPTFLRYKSR